MPGTRCADSVIFAGPADLPADARALMEGRDFFSTACWWQTMLEAGLPDGAAPRFLLLRDGGRPALIPLMARNGRLVSLTNSYTCLYQPLLAPGLDDPRLHRIGLALGGYCRAYPAVRLDALPEDMPGLDALLKGVRRAGLLSVRFDHFGNWHEDVAGLDWHRYLQARPGALRETVRRRLRRAEALRFSVVTGPEGLAEGIAAYEAVYARSWKIPEPLPLFNAALMRHAAAVGMLRLGLLHGGAGESVAAQLWIVRDGWAGVLKLAHDEAWKSFSPGTVLTAMMIRRLLEEEHVTELDFGRGDDAYKQLWAGRRRQRIGVLLLNPLRASGLARLGRHGAGRVAAGFRRLGEKLP